MAEPHFSHSKMERMPHEDWVVRKAGCNVQAWPSFDPYFRSEM